VRNSGDYTAWQALNLHSMQAFDKGSEVHVQALPSLAEVMYQQYRSKKEAMTSRSKDEVLAKYGNTGEPHGGRVNGQLAGEQETHAQGDGGWQYVLASVLVHTH
jgi:pre-mRNA-processing factor SLU7